MAQTCEVIKMDQTGEAARKRAERLVAAPVLDKGWSIEYSQHRLLAGTMEDARVTFEHDLNRILDEKGIKLPSERKTYLLENMLAVPTWQPSPTWKELAGGDWQSANLDLSLYPNMEVNKVRKQLYNKIVLWGAAMREAVAKRGYWADLACPITGNCMFGERTAHVYNELDGLTMMLGYDSLPIGCCGIVLHPQWAKSAYPVTLFTLAPSAVLIDAVNEVGQSVTLPDIEDQAEKDLVDGDSCM